MSLSLDRISLSVNGLPHLDGISATFPRGTLTTVLGRTLAGKTTLLRAVAGLQGVDGGTMLRDGEPFGDLPAWKRDVAMVYQQFINYPHLSVFENVAFPLRRRGLPEGEVKSRADAALAMVGLVAFAERRPAALSGGQQQRVALARALVRRADILLLDEPLVNLDYKLREQLRDEFRGLIATQSETTVIYNTTEPAEAMMLGDRMIVMHEGRILQSGEPAAIFERPANVLVAGIVNDPPMTVVSGHLTGGLIRFGAAVSTVVPAHLAALPEGAYRFGIRASDIAVSGEEGLAGRATFSEVSGSETFVHLETEIGAAVVQMEGVHSVAMGDAMRLSLPGERLFAFSAEGEGALLGAPERGES